MNMVSDPIQLPIRAGNVFRLLAMRTTADDPDFVEAFFRQFDQFLEAIQQTERLKPSCKADYLNYRKEHKPKAIKGALRKMTEENLCASKNGFMSLGDNSAIGRVIDYQIPLNSSSTAGEGVVDLISTKDDFVYVIEAKKFGSKESPLRAMVEALTFWAFLVDQKKLVAGNAATFIRRYNESKSKTSCIPIDAKSAVLIPAILIDKDSPIFRELNKLAGARRNSKLFILVRCFSYDEKLTVKSVRF